MLTAETILSGSEFYILRVATWKARLRTVAYRQFVWRHSETVGAGGKKTLSTNHV